MKHLGFGKSFTALVNWAQGRHTLFALWFAGSGLWLQWLGKLDGNYIALIGAVQAFVFAHSAKEDYFASKTESANLTTQPENKEGDAK